MKKLTTILILTFISISAFSQIKISQGFGLECYTINKYKIIKTTQINLDKKPASYQDVSVFRKGSFACKYKFTAKLKRFSLTAKTNIYMNKAQSYQFAPTHAEFTINLGYRIKKLSFKIEHNCVHDIISFKVPPVQLQGGYSKIGVYWNW